MKLALARPALKWEQAIMENATEEVAPITGAARGTGRAIALRIRRTDAGEANPR